MGILQSFGLVRLPCTLLPGLGIYWGDVLLAQIHLEELELCWTQALTVHQRHVVVPFNAVELQAIELV
jgi:hypothetical protein